MGNDENPMIVIEVAEYKDRKVDYRKKVWCYRNLHRSCYSMIQNSLVVGHSDFLMLSDVAFVVREAGRQRVLSSGKKNVHAFATGIVCESVPAEINGADFCPIRYNPKRSAYFETMVGDDWVPIRSARYVSLSPLKIWACEPQFV